MSDACCAPNLGGPREPAVAQPPPSAAVEGSAGRHDIEQRAIPTGSYTMGDSYGDGRAADGETHRHPVRVDAFTVDATSVTNGDFAAFVDATGYATEAETFGYSAVFQPALAADAADVVGQPPGTPWWLGVRGADWRHPGGRHSGIGGLDDHPVVHVSWNDAQAYCAWAGRRLPTEAEWERASRGGLDDRRYPWGDELHDAANPDAWRCNIWQGRFPVRNTLEDGYLTTAPVRTYEPNGFGLWQTVGNVWEWCADWFDAGYYEASPMNNPTGPSTGAARVMRGGSFLCHESYCNRYRNSARSSNTPDSSSANVGFRTVALA